MNDYFRGRGPFRPDHNMDPSTLNELVYNIVPFCAAQVERQGDGPSYVPFMVKAWKFAAQQVVYGAQPTVYLSRLLAGTVIGSPNVAAFRKIPVYFRDGTFAPKAENVERLMNQLFEALDDPDIQLSIEDFCYEFLRIHPFVDGNGRVAVLLYNMLNGTIKEPVDMPEFFLMAWNAGRR